jgi:hypothetical protein
MQKFIPFAKLSKKSQQAINKSRRKSWGNIDPVTKRPANAKAYNRKKAQAWKDGFPTPELFIFYKFLCRLCRYVPAERSC